MNFRGRRILVVGLGASGLAAALLLAGQGAEVRATDSRPAGELGPRLKELDQAGVELFLSGHPEEIFTSAELIVPSPGVRPDLPGLKAAAAKGVPLVGELALAASLLTIPLVAVSGTNGKSTTTALTAHLLSAGGRKVFLGGNIGRPLSEYFLGGGPADLAVAEVSSFQLETMPWEFKPRVAVLTNLSPDHLDRHGTFQAYAAAKARLWADLGARETLLLNRDDPATPSLARDLQVRIATFGLTPADGPGASLRARARALLRDHQGREEEVDLSGFRLPGPHNLENLLAALAAAWLMGAEPEAMAESLAGFKALPHRLEWIREAGGVDFYNDSKATNVVSAAKAVAGFDKPVILIAGGLDKGAGYAELVEAARGRVKAAVLIGRAAGLIARELNGVCPVHQAGELERAVTLSRDLARPGEVVLLSPACASYDQFKNFEERGKAFADAVRRL